MMAERSRCNSLLVFNRNDQVLFRRDNMLVRPKILWWPAVFLIVMAVLSVVSFIRVAHAGGGDKGGAELWVANCRQCHNLRVPSSFSSDRWEMLVTHMR